MKASNNVRIVKENLYLALASEEYYTMCITTCTQTWNKGNTWLRCVRNHALFRELWHYEAWGWNDSCGLISQTCRMLQKAIMICIISYSHFLLIILTIRYTAKLVTQWISEYMWCCFFTSNYNYCCFSHWIIDETLTYVFKIAISNIRWK